MNILQKFKPIKLIAMDVDGVLTDGKLWLMPSLDLVRNMDIKDGYALQLAVKKGYHVVVISGAVDTGAVENRLKGLGILDVNMAVKDKSALLNKKISEWGFTRDQVLFIGDDIHDYEVMKNVGLSCCPADAVAEIIQIADYISSYKGGCGCVRDVIEKVLKLNNDWDLDAEVVSK